MHKHELFQTNKLKSDKNQEGEAFLVNCRQMTDDGRRTTDDGRRATGDTRWYMQSTMA